MADPQAYCRGLYLSLAILSRWGRGMRAEAVAPTVPGLSVDELAMLKRRASYGCICLVCCTKQEAVRSFSSPGASAARSFPSLPFNSVFAARFPTWSDELVPSAAISYGAAGPSWSSTPTDRSQDLLASTARRGAANISRERTSHRSAILPILSSPFSAGE